jgi:serine/threonine protein kinase
VLQSLFALADHDLYRLTPGSSTFQYVVSELSREARMLSSLSHRNILRFHGLVYDRFTGYPKYLVMERASSSLRGYVAALTRPLSLDELMWFCQDVLHGLAYLHSLTPRAVIH